MGFMDDMKVAAAGAADAASSAASSARMRLELSDLNRRRQGLFAQLGEALYDAERSDASLRAINEGLFEAIESLDVRRMELQGTLEALERPRPVPVRPQAASLTCPACGAPVEEGDLFCMSCGERLEPRSASPASKDEHAAQLDTGAETPAFEAALPARDVAGEPVPEPTHEPEPAFEPEQRYATSTVPPAQVFCTVCGRPMRSDDVFCGWCGSRVSQG